MEQNNNMNNYLHKKVCALELWEQTKKSRDVEIIAIVGFVCVIGLCKIHLLVGAVGAIVFSVFISLFLSKDIVRMNYLNKEYNLKKKHIEEDSEDDPR